jgi:hypothetical protein
MLEGRLGPRSPWGPYHLPLKRLKVPPKFCNFHQIKFLTPDSVSSQNFSPENTFSHFKMFNLNNFRLHQGTPLRDFCEKWPFHCYWGLWCNNGCNNQHHKSAIVSLHAPVGFRSIPQLSSPWQGFKTEFSISNNVFIRKISRHEKFSMALLKMDPKIGFLVKFGSRNV